MLLDEKCQISPLKSMVIGGQPNFFGEVWQFFGPPQKKNLDLNIISLPW